MPRALSRQKIGWSAKVLRQETQVRSARPRWKTTMLAGSSVCFRCMRDATRAHKRIKVTSTRRRRVWRQNCTASRWRTTLYCLNQPGQTRSRSSRPSVAYPTPKTRSAASPAAAMMACAWPSQPPSSTAWASTSPEVLMTKSTSSSLLALSSRFEIRIISFSTSDLLGGEPSSFAKTSRSSSRPNEPSLFLSSLSHSLSIMATTTLLSSLAFHLRLLGLLPLSSSAPVSVALGLLLAIIFFSCSFWWSTHLSVSKCGEWSGNSELLTSPEMTSMSQSAGLSEAGNTKPKASK
mmetsp:Transcript_102880/g.320565  ORF Transcript_102880/g.320565 Transcript_102880/m.320565 type:complete len:292 (+) Transcript_102880:853-1728(+)